MDNVSSSKYGGTGLGLSISRSLVLLMGSDISVKSEPGKGSTFSFKLRLKKTDASSDEKHHDPRVSVKPQLAGHLLLVDDTEVNLVIAETLLKQMGISCDRATDGKEAIKAWEQNHYDLILMDYRMPNMDGYQATQIIRSQEQDKRIPIIAITASATINDRAHCIAGGMDEVLTKPFTKDAFYSVLAQFLPQQITTGASSEPNLAPDSEPFIEIERLNELKKVMGDAADQVVKLGLESIEKRMAQLESMLPDIDLKKSFIAAHTIKSSAATLGAHVLSDIAKRVEKQSQDGSWLTAKQDITLMKEAVGKLKVFLSNWK